MKILIFGMGQVGSQLRAYLEQRGETVIGLDGSVDIRDAARVSGAVANHMPDIVVNAVAKTNLEWCEDNKLEAFAVNTLGAENIGRACVCHGVYLVHISSGCIQESVSRDDVPTEEDTPNPLSYYSWTKVWAEELLGSLVNRKNLKALIVRPRQLLSAIPNRSNALVKMLTYRQFIDTAQSCTVVADLLHALHELMQRRIVGVYNVVNPGTVTPYEIAGLLKELIDPTMEFTKIDKRELDAKMRAIRIDCVLSPDKLAELGIVLSELHNRLREIITELAVNLKSADAPEVMRTVQEDTANKLSGI